MQLANIRRNEDLLVVDGVALGQEGDGAQCNTRLARFYIQQFRDVRWRHLLAHEQADTLDGLAARAEDDVLVIDTTHLNQLTAQ